MTAAKSSQKVLAMGFFDGVHLGHAALLRQTAARAEERGLMPAVMTFDTHPDSLVQGRPVPLICSAPTRAELIREGFGIDEVIFLQFSDETMRIPWRDFVDSLRAELGTRHFVVGYDFRFGWHGEGTAQKLADYCADAGLGCDIVPQVTLDGIPVSSTHIRTLLETGDIETANRFLGHPYLLVDVVRHGYHLGSRLGAPTINMRFPEGVLPLCHGVYATKARLPDGGEHVAVTNVGVRPTVSGNSACTVESFILDYDGNLYGKPVHLSFFAYLRPEYRFDDVEALKAAIVGDAGHVKTFFEK